MINHKINCNKCNKNKAKYITEFKEYAFIYPYIKIGFCEKCFNQGNLKIDLKQELKGGLSLENGRFK